MLTGMGCVCVCVCVCSTAESALVAHSKKIAELRCVDMHVLLVCTTCVCFVCFPVHTGVRYDKRESSALPQRSPFKH